MVQDLVGQVTGSEAWTGRHEACCSEAVTSLSRKDSCASPTFMHTSKRGE